MPLKITRQIALKRGLARYHGRPCPVCYGHWRYTGNRNCVACDRERKAGTRQAGGIYARETKLARKLIPIERAAAKRDGLQVYLSAVDCLTCDNGRPARYASNGQCVACARRKAQERDAMRDRTSERHARQGATMGPMEGLCRSILP